MKDIFHEEANLGASLPETSPQGNIDLLPDNSTPGEIRNAILHESVPQSEPTLVSRVKVWVDNHLFRFIGRGDQA